MADESEQQHPTVSPNEPRLTRRSLIGVAAGVAVGASGLTLEQHLASRDTTGVGGENRDALEPFYGPHQGGITTSPQSHTYFAAIDLTTERRLDVAELLRGWTGTAVTLTRGTVPGPSSDHPDTPALDSGETIGLGAARLTVTFGFGPGLFEQDGADRYGLKARRPAALVDLPRFPGDQLIAAKTGGDLTIQACADDPQVAFHAVRQLVRAADGVAQVRWTQAGFNETPATNGTPRNLMGFKDGTINPRTDSHLDQFVWVGSEGPAWMRGGSYLVVRRIRISLEHWDTKPVAIQEQVVGRHKLSGAPIGQNGEFDALNLDATDKSGNPLIPTNSHVRLSAPQMNEDQMILRRGYAYNDGVDPFIERWPPWKQALMYDAGLLFTAYQRDPRKGFIPIFQNLAENDSLAQFTTHTGSAIAAIPPAPPQAGNWIGEDLFQT